MEKYGKHGEFSIELGWPKDTVDDLIWCEMTLGGPYGQVAQDSGFVFLKIYGADYDSIIELYNFNLTIGDTAYTDQDGGNYAIVEEIETTTILGVEKTMLHLSNGDEWIEGLGSTQGPLRPIISTFETSYVICDYSGSYIDNLGEFGSYSYTAQSSRCFLNTVEEKTPSKIIISPNPSYETVTIDYSGNETTYRIIDVNGRILKFEK